MHIPVCGSDEKVYANYCLLRKTACETNTTIKIIRHGNCTTKKKLAKPRCNDESCPPYAKCNDTDTEIQCTCPNCSSHTGKKVCGSNGKMYIDSCDLRKHSCKENIKVTEAKHGCAVIERVPLMRRNKTQTQVKTKKEKPINNFKTFYISMAFVGGLGVVIGLGMCICRPLKSKKESGNGRSGDHHRDKSVESI
ncbi:PREDICTED: tomoregulin-2-like isoform X2 [Acropora digitifera]|uniref:tomoregulin-2-like isoform X2 n=1 Tax=Acropora digitifera TaxID=70779 RepID=UPI00077AE0AB|nr:PREDICTED: tomoregulin-2-like isoform X2 [Acropora digitifera]